MKRYAVTVDFYIYAENDEEAKRQSFDWLEKRKLEDDNKMSIVSIDETSFGSLQSRKIK